MTFTYDWFSHNIPTWEKFVVPNVPAKAHILELGAFEGRATVWMAEKWPDAMIFCVDTWHGSAEHTNIDMIQVAHNFIENTKDLAVASYNESTVTFLARSRLLFDLIYVDASHTARDVLVDGLLAWRSLKPNGIMVFDDYEWPGGKDVHDRPQLGINLFMAMLRSTEFNILHKGYQIILQKLA